MSKTVPLLDGTVTLFDRDEITRRRVLPYDILRNQSDALLGKLAYARRVVSPDGKVEESPDLDGPEYRLTAHEAETLEYMQLAQNWSWLKTWTIDYPLPGTWEDLLDLPQKVADALHNAVLKHAQGQPASVVEGFQMSEETLEDKQSFTGEPGSSKTRSGGNAKRRTSTRKTSTS